MLIEGDNSQRLSVRLADLEDTRDQQVLVELLDMYARDPMGEGAPLPKDVRQRLIPGLRHMPTCRPFLADWGEQPAGLAICFLGFSSFRARPLINIHDLAVAPAFRGLGVGRALLAAVERSAREWGCCRITLEVRRDNHLARGLYRRAGFAAGSEDAEAFAFWKKELD